MPLSCGCTPTQGWSGVVHGGLLAATVDVLAQVRTRHPDLVVYLSQTGHGHVHQAVTTLGQTSLGRVARNFIAAPLILPDPCLSRRDP